MKSTKPQWWKTSVQGLYEYRPAGISENERGTYYSRFCVNRQRTFRSLGTNIWEQAKLSHVQRQAGVENVRQRGGGLGTEFRTLGVLLQEAQKRMAEASQKKRTVGPSTCFRWARLYGHTVGGTFSAFHVASNRLAARCEDCRGSAVYVPKLSSFTSLPPSSTNRVATNTRAFILLRELVSPPETRRGSDTGHQSGAKRVFSAYTAIAAATAPSGHVTPMLRRQ